MIGKFKTAIADTVGPSSKHRAVQMVFEANDEGKDVDPEVQTIVRKIALMRRIIDKFSTKKKCTSRR